MYIEILNYMKKIFFFICFIIFIGCTRAQKFNNCDTINNSLKFKISKILKYENDSFRFYIKLFDESKDSITIKLSFQNLHNSSIYIVDKLHCSEFGKNYSINSIVRNEPNEHHYSNIFTLYEPNETFEWIKKTKKKSIDEIDFMLEFTFNINKLLENYSAIRDNNDSIIKVKGLEKEFIHCGLESISILGLKIHNKNKIILLTHTKVY